MLHSDREILAEFNSVNINSINAISQLKKKYPQYPVGSFISLRKLWEQAAGRIKKANKYIFTEKSIQQASSDQLAEYHKEKFRSFSSVADLCCGSGMDLINLAKNKETVYAVDLDPDILEAAAYNSRQENISHITFLNIKAEQFAKPVQALFIDPDRRTSRGRTISLYDMNPNFTNVLQLINKYGNVAVKVAPAIDYKKEHFPEPFTLEFVSDNGVLKEILLCFGELATSGIKRKAVLLPENTSLGSAESDSPADLVKCTSPQEFIHEPDPAIIRAGLVQNLGFKLSADIIDRNIALLTSAQSIRSSFIRNYRVIDYFDYDLRKLKSYLRTHDIGVLVIKTRGFPDSAEDFRKKLKLSGNNMAILFIIRYGSKHIFLICESS